jgi:transcription initiation factor TFIIIB Brf1 subunit/transcription initiation factor TFIIB
MICESCKKNTETLYGISNLFQKLKLICAVCKSGITPSIIMNEDEIEWGDWEEKKGRWDGEAFHIHNTWVEHKVIIKGCIFIKDES